MLKTKQLLYLSILLFFVACSSTKNTAVKTVFPFEYQGKEYTIISIVSAEGDDGINMLTYHKNDSLIFRTRDDNMDGNMDFVLNGKTSLDSANIIYEYGIHEAIRQDKFNSIQSIRQYDFQTENHKFTVRTFGFFKDEIYNEFIIADKRRKPIATFLDINANGQLNDTKYGDFSLEEAQKYYTLVLESGLDDNQITTANEKLIVNQSKP